MTTRRRPLGPGPATHSPRDPDAGDDRPGPALRVHATDADLDGGTLYRPDLDALADMRARGVLGGQPPAANDAPRSYGHGAAPSGKADCVHAPRADQ